MRVNKLAHYHINVALNKILAEGCLQPKNTLKHITGKSELFELQGTASPSQSTKASVYGVVVATLSVVPMLSITRGRKIANVRACVKFYTLLCKP